MQVYLEKERAASHMRAAAIERFSTGFALAGP
jgi:hypothetical protein